MTTKNHSTQISNVLVIGSGGAGLRAAIECKLMGVDVTILGKRNKNDVHTVLAAGGINAAFGNVDPEDSWKQHFADTYLEGYGIGDPEIIELLVKESPQIVSEIDEWGARLNKLENGKLDQRFFGAHTYRRTCYSGDYTGKSILFTLLKKANSLQIPIFDSQYVTDILTNNGICFGAMSFNTNTGERTIHLADSVILATGGHTRIWQKSSSRKNENTGDGYYLGLKAGCKLTDMEMVQFHPTGMILPEDLSGTLVTEAVRGEGGRLFNINGDRFMKNYDLERMELSTRDRVAMANYIEISEGRGTKNGGVFLDISHQSKEYIIKKIPKIYRQFIDAQRLDISKNAMEVAPTAHYSMGGLLVTPEKHSTNIQGLFAAGEVAGGIHGANRLGGNSLAEILVFGKQSGKAAADHSKSIQCHYRSKSSINSAHEKIDSLIKKGTEISVKLIYDLRDIMWKYCGVVRNKENLTKGLKEINQLKIALNDVDVRITSEDISDLTLAFELEASIMSAEATMISALERKESRGSHQRSDYKEKLSSNGFNIRVSLSDQKQLEINRTETIDPRNELKAIIENTEKVKNFKGKLIE